MIKIAPSILSADFSNMGQAVSRLEVCGADFIHCDVMDGSFVPNLTFGMPMIKDIRKFSSLPFDVHLMIVNPENYIESFVNAGANILTFHTTATSKTCEVIKKINDLGVLSGVAFNPNVPITGLDKIVDSIDLVLIMSVYAGFGGQKFIPSTMEKIEQVVKIREKYKKNLLIEVDGGVNLENIRALEDAGVDIAVAGSSVFGVDDMAKRISDLKGLK